MKQIYKKVTMLIVVLLATGALMAQNVGDTFTSGQLKYEIISLSPKEVKVIQNNPKPTGDITIPATIDYNSNSYNVTTIGESAFAYCSGLTSVIIPNSVTTIGREAFYFCTALTSVTIPNSVTTIGESAFSNCYALTSATIPNSVTTIGEQAFIDCDVLTSVTIPNSVTTIGEQAFIDCDALTSVTIGKNVTTIGKKAFIDCDALTSFVVDTDNMTYSAENGVFFNKNKTILIQCPTGRIGNYTIPNSVTSIGEYAFYRCKGLTSVTIPNSVTAIENYAFSYCEGLTSVTIPNSITTIKYSAFSDCDALTEVTIPNSVTTIEESAFAWCDALTSVTIPNSVTTIGGDAFGNCHALTSFVVDTDNTTYSSDNGVLFNKNKTTLIQYPIGKTDTEYTIPNSVTTIGKSAFYYCEGITSITIGENVTTIENSAFAYCDALTSITSLIEDVNSVNMESNVFYNVDKNTCTLYVPNGKVNDYKAADQWKDFQHIEAISGGGSKPFITKWNTNKPASTISGKPASTNTQIYFPGIGTNYTIEWEEVGDATHTGTLTNVTTTENNPLLIDFDSVGTYIVKVQPAGFERIKFGKDGIGAYGDQEKLIQIQQWGAVQWTSMAFAFAGCINMQLTATDAPDLSNVPNMSYMFKGCTAFNGDISGWDVSNVTYMGWMFSGCTAFNQPLNNWGTKVSNVTSMGYMFYGCTTFNQPLNNWNVSNVTAMYAMFRGCTAFNQPLNSWNVSNVTDMSRMFDGCTAFNQDISNWNVSKITYMGWMFKDCTAFNQDLSSWNIKSVVHNEGVGIYSLKDMFNGSGMSCQNYDATLIGWANNNETPDNLQLGAAGLKYTVQDAVDARQALIDKGWVITGDTHDATCYVPVTVTDININPLNLAMEVGSTQQLTATVAPSNASNKVVTWSSSNESVATVDATGEVTAVAAGTATITVTTVDGGFTDVCEVTVTNVTPPATPTIDVVNHCGYSVLTAGNYTGDLLWSTGETTVSITVTESKEYTLVQKVGGVSSNPASENVEVLPIPGKPAITVEADTLITTAATKYYWFLDDSPITGNNMQKLVIDKSGNYSVQIENDKGCKSEVSDKIYVVYSSAANQEVRIVVYPNPVTDQLTVEGLPTAGNPELKLYNVAGQLIVHKQCTNSIEKIDMSDKISGIYLLKIVDHKINKSIKIIKP